MTSPFSKSPLLAEREILCILALNAEYDPIEVTSQTVLVSLGWGATQSAQVHAFSHYQRGKATNTLKTQYRALQLWTQFLNSSAEKQRHDAAFSAETYFSEPAGWGSVTWGLVLAFYDWLLHKGFSVTTTAYRTSTPLYYVADSIAITPYTCHNVRMRSKSQPSFEWDDDKDKLNQQKQGVPFAVAHYAFADPRRVILKDVTHSTPAEECFFCLAEVGEGILTVRFTWRSGRIRIFGAGYWRKGRKLYVDHNQL